MLFYSIYFYSFVVKKILECSIFWKKQEQLSFDAAKENEKDAYKERLVEAEGQELISLFNMKSSIVICRFESIYIDDFFDVLYILAQKFKNHPILQEHNAEQLADCMMRYPKTISIFNKISGFNLKFYDSFNRMMELISKI
jgi:hypothetical protein